MDLVATPADPWVPATASGRVLRRVLAEDGEHGGDMATAREETRSP